MAETHSPDPSTEASTRFSGNADDQEHARIEASLRRKYRVPHRTSRTRTDGGYTSRAAKEAISSSTNDLGAILEHEFITKSAIPRNETEAAVISSQEDLGAILAAFMRDEPILDYCNYREHAIHIAYSAVDKIIGGRRALSHLERLAQNPDMAVRAVQTKLDLFKTYHERLNSDSSQLTATVKDIGADKNVQHCRVAQSSMRLGVLKDLRTKLETAAPSLEEDYAHAIRTGDQELVQQVSAEMENHEEDFGQLELDLSDTVNDLRNARYTIGILQNLESQIREDALTTRKNIQHLGGLASKYAAILSIMERVKGYAPGRELSELRSLVERSDAQAAALGRLSAARLRGAFALPEPRPLEIAQSYLEPGARTQRIERLISDAEGLVSEYVENPTRFIKVSPRSVHG